DAPNNADERVALLQRRLHVEEDELVGAAVGVGRAELHRIADVAEPLELHALHDAPGGDVEARDQARERNRSLTSPSTRSRKRAPQSPVFSGWNCTPRNDPD